MNAERLLMVFPNQVTGPIGSEMTVHQWSAIAEQFTAQGGREVILGGAEPLAYAGFWPVARRSLKARAPRVTAYVSGSFLEPRVCREIIESGLHVLIALDSIQPEPHDALHGHGSHGRAMAALERFMKDGLAERVGVLATATKLNHRDLPLLAAWAAGRGVTRFLWTPVPDGGWPSPQLAELRLSPQAKTTLAEQVTLVGRGPDVKTYIGQADPLEDPAMGAAYSRTIRVRPDGEAFRGFSGEGGYLGNLKRTPLLDVSNQMTEVAASRMTQVAG